MKICNISKLIKQQVFFLLLNYVVFIKTNLGGGLYIWTPTAFSQDQTVLQQTSNQLHLFSNDWGGDEPAAGEYMAVATITAFGKIEFAYDYFTCN